MNVVWEESYFLTAEQVVTLDLFGISVNDKESTE